MKTFLKSTISPILCLILLFCLTHAKTVQAKENKTDKPKQIQTFNRIVVTGNVELLLVPRENIGIAYEDNTETNAKVTQQGNKLHIAGKTHLTTRIVLYINDIYRIEAHQNAKVRSEAVINAKHLQVVLKDGAEANLNVNTEGLYTAISDSAVLKLEGSSNHHNLLASGASKFIANHFICQNINNNSLAINFQKLAN